MLFISNILCDHGDTFTIRLDEQKLLEKIASGETRQLSFLRLYTDRSLFRDE